MPRSFIRCLLIAGLLAGALWVAPTSQAISRCIDCTCASACDLRCWNGFAVDTCGHYLCVDFCFPGPLSSEVAAEAEAAPDAGAAVAECVLTPSSEADSLASQVPQGPEVAVSAEPRLP